MVSASRLLRVLAASAKDHGCIAVLTIAAERSWASATFLGARYDVSALMEAGKAADRWIAALPDIDLAMPLQFAGEVCVVERRKVARNIEIVLEVLVIEE